jgi:hypothetical protein
LAHDIARFDILSEMVRQRFYVDSAVPLSFPSSEKIIKKLLTIEFRLMLKKRNS